jgi:hypothetical protein
MCVTMKKPVQRRFFIHLPTLSSLDILRIIAGLNGLSTGYPQISTGYPQQLTPTLELNSVS